MRPFWICALAMAALVVGARTGAGKPKADPYAVQVVPEPEGHLFPASRMEDLNDRGDVLLWTSLKDRRQVAHLWSEGKLRDLGTLGGTFVWPHALNNRRQVVGESFVRDGSTHAFLWESGKMRDLGTEPGLHSGAWGINEKGDAVGWLTEPRTRELGAVRWQNGVLERLPDFGRGSAAQFIAARGLIMGFGKGSEGGYWRIFEWRNDRVRDFSAFSGWQTASLGDVNGRGIGVGSLSRNQSPHGGGESLPIRYDEGRLEELPAFTEVGLIPRAINDSGWILGATNSAQGGHFRAHLFRDGRFSPLDDLIRGSGWKITGIGQLNNRGQITAYGERGEERRALLLTPRSQRPGPFSRTHSRIPSPRKKSAGARYPFVITSRPTRRRTVTCSDCLASVE
jgi:probable HAF family extracellular repeat protein